MAFDQRSLFLTSPQRQIQLIQILALKRKEEIYRNQALEHKTRQEFAEKQDYLHHVNLEHDQKRYALSRVLFLLIAHFVASGPCITSLRMGRVAPLLNLIFL